MNPNDPAFPSNIPVKELCVDCPHGLTKRECSAMINQAAILSGIYANPDLTNILKRSMDDIAKEALKHTDVLIAALSKENG